MPELENHQTLSEYLASQEELLHDAAETLPHDFSRCTYSLGHIRQAVYLCKSCPEQRGICSACSIACHTDHEQLELFPKRNFRCDCPTSAIGHQCTLHKTLEDENSSNIYGQNFTGVFCRCHRPYVAENEAETMIQCLSCEDWFHESCLNLRDPPPPEGISEQANETIQVDSTLGIDDSASDASSSGLPPPLISASDYDSLICTACVLDIPILQRWAGTPGVLMVVRENDQRPWKIIGSSSNSEADSHIVDVVDEETSSVEVGAKRRRSPSNQDMPPEEKRLRTSGPEVDSSATSRSLCVAPPPNQAAQVILEGVRKLTTGGYPLGTGDIFLTEGWRERWCHCETCLGSLAKHPFLKEEEETYEPPEDPDSAMSLEELGMRALERLPRDRAIEGIHAFNSMRDSLVSFLRPFATEGKVVNNQDIESFFDSLRSSSEKDAGK